MSETHLLRSNRIITGSIPALDLAVEITASSTRECLTTEVREVAALVRRRDPLHFRDPYDRLDNRTDMRSAKSSHVDEFLRATYRHPSATPVSTTISCSRRFLASSNSKMRQVQRMASYNAMETTKGEVSV